MKLYKDELIRLRYLLEQAHMGNETAALNSMPDTMPTSGRPSVTHYTHSPINLPQSSNGSQPMFMLPSQTSSATGNFKVGTSSQTNFFPDTMSNFSNNAPVTTHTTHPGVTNNNNTQHQTLTNDQISNGTNENLLPTQLPPLKAGPASHTTPVLQQMQMTGMSNAMSSNAVSSEGYTPNAPQTNQLTSLSQVDTKDNEFVQMLTSQLAEKDAQIRKLQA